MSKPVEPFEIFIKGNTDKSYVIYVWSTTSVLDMKVLFHIKSGDELLNMRLFYQGKQLKDNQTVGQLGIKKDDTLLSVNRLLGGGEVRILPIAGPTGPGDPANGLDFGF
jgi:hypothetical protein